MHKADFLMTLLYWLEPNYAVPDLQDLCSPATVIRARDSATQQDSYRFSGEIYRIIIQSLPERTATAAVYLLLGALPVEAHKKQLSLRHSI